MDGSELSKSLSSSSQLKMICTLIALKEIINFTSAHSIPLIQDSLVYT